MKKRIAHKTNRTLNTGRQGAFVVTDLQTEEGYALRLAEGEPWDNRAMHLAMLMSGQAYVSKLDFGDRDNDAQPGRPIRQVTIRRNSFIPEFEPSRHEMRIFDALDGIVTEM